MHHLGTGNLQQPAVHRVGNGLLLYGAVNDDPLKLHRADGLGRDRRVDGGLEQFLNAGLANGGAKPANLGGIAGKLRLVVDLAAEVLPHHILGPTLDQLFVAQIESVLEVQE